MTHNVTQSGLDCTSSAQWANAERPPCEAQLHSFALASCSLPRHFFAAHLIPLILPASSFFLLLVCIVSHPMDPKVWRGYRIKDKQLPYLGKSLRDAWHFAICKREGGKKESQKSQWGFRTSTCMPRRERSCREREREVQERGGISAFSYTGSSVCYWR